MSSSDGAVLGMKKIVNHGLATERWNLVIVSEGYQPAEMAQFAADAQQFVNTLFATPPFPVAVSSGLISDAVNVYRIDVTSTESGADDPTDCGGTGDTPATYFDASFCGYGGVQRLLLVNEDTVLTVADAQVPHWHAIVVLVNSPIYGGSGGTVAVASRAPTAIQIALHELGHSAFGLADEYEYYEGCGIDIGHDHHPAVEPTEQNVTTKHTRATIKWGPLIAASTAVPTTKNANCAVCDPQASPVPPGVVGAFEGAHYYHCGAFRPEFNCRMRDLAFGFCAVCQQRIRETLEPHVP